MLSGMRRFFMLRRPRLCLFPAAGQQPHAAKPVQRAPCSDVPHAKIPERRSYADPPVRGFERCAAPPPPSGKSDYIMPPIPPPGIGGMAGCSDFFSASTHSVVRNIEAIDAAFSSATRDTFVGSMIPALSRSS